MRFSISLNSSGITPKPAYDTSLLGDLQIDCRLTAGAAISFEFVNDLLAVFQAAQTSAFDSGNMDENVLPPLSGWINP